MARAALELGWSVDLVHGPMQVSPPAGVTAHPVVTTTEMLERCLALHPGSDVVIGAAAVCDFRPTSLEERKHKRGPSSWTVELTATEDILETLSHKKDSRVHAGFALETGDLEANAALKLRRKKLDWIVGNSPRAIGADASEYLLLGRDGSRLHLGTLTKKELAERLLAKIKESVGA